MRLPKSGLIPWLLMAATPVLAQINAGTLPATASPPFKVSKVAQFDLPWRIAFLPDGRMLVTEKVGKLLLAAQDRSEEHTSELQSHLNLVCRLLLEKKKKEN